MSNLRSNENKIIATTLSAELKASKHLEKIYVKSSSYIFWVLYCIIIMEISFKIAWSKYIVKTSKTLKSISFLLHFEVIDFNLDSKFLKIRKFKNCSKSEFFNFIKSSNPSRKYYCKASLLFFSNLLLN